MKIMVVYDSAYGNTEQVARAIGVALGPGTGVYRVGELHPEELDAFDLLVVGSPTQRFNATQAINDLLKSLPSGGLTGRCVAAFDTRLTAEGMKAMSSFLSFSAGLVGESAYAARHIANELKKKGGKLVAPPEGFFVQGAEGPLVEGELERAADWAKRISLVS